MGDRSINLQVRLAIAIAAMALVSLPCDGGVRDFGMYSTTSVESGSSVPNTLISVARGSAAQLAIGKVGATPAQTSLAWDSRSRFLFGVARGADRWGRVRWFRLLRHGGTTK